MWRAVSTTHWKKPTLDVLLVDSSGLLSAIDAGEPDHARVRAWLEQDRRPLIVTDYVVAEVDYLVLRRLGFEAEQAFVDQILDGTFRREPVGDADIQRAQQIAARFKDQALGLTDASLMALSERLGARDVLTLDHRHFSLFRDSKGRALRLLP